MNIKRQYKLKKKQSYRINKSDGLEPKKKEENEFKVKLAKLRRKTT